jgi:hypothetical protein
LSVREARDFLQPEHRVINLPQRPLGSSQVISPVVLIVFLFLRDVRAILIPSATVPLANPLRHRARRVDATP